MIIGRRCPESRLTHVLKIAVLVAAATCISNQGHAGQGNNRWAFRPVQKPEVPAVKQVNWAQNPIDNFILARLEREGIHPSPPADSAILLRRVTLDLAGLPPSPEEIETFVADRSPAKYEHAIDRLLASPHFGERWGRHWLDVARYADSAGYESDNKREIWKYRDWVIQSLNADMPYDEFLIEQLAGDLMTPVSDERLIASGFNCNALKQQNDSVETVVDRVNTFGTAYLGLTVGCARCHDHKFDPISRREFYQLYAFFNQADDTEHEFAPPEEVAERSALKRQVAQLKKEMVSYQNGPDRDPQVWAARLSNDELNSISNEVRQAIGMLSKDRSAAQLELIRAAHAEAEAQYQHNLKVQVATWSKSLPETERRTLEPLVQAYLALPIEKRGDDIPPTLLTSFWKNDAGLSKRKQVITELEERIPHGKQTLVMQQRPNAQKTFVSLDQTDGPEVQPNVPAALPPLRMSGRTPNRLDLAQWAAARENPLVARVAVNRIWQHYFGTGIVETSDNLGVQSPPPSHPELLDWLAAELMDHGWHLKHIHRLIITSSTYRQSSRARQELEVADPQNRLLARQSRIRLDAEIIRDAALATSGLLDLTVGGPSVFPYQPAGVMAGRADGLQWKESDGSSRHRRGIYTHFWRLTPHPYFRLFDAPDATESCTRRARTNTPLQALMLLNDPWFMEAAVSMATRTLQQHPEQSDDYRIERMYGASLGRKPSAEETQIIFNLLRDQQKSFERDPTKGVALLGDKALKDNAARQAAWTSVARALLNLDEFITRE